MSYPPADSYPPPPGQGSYPPPRQPGGYPPRPQGSHPGPQQGHPDPQQGHPGAQHGGYPQQGGYPHQGGHPQHGGHAGAPSGGYPGGQGGGYGSQGGGYGGESGGYGGQGSGYGGQGGGYGGQGGYPTQPGGYPGGPQGGGYGPPQQQGGGYGPPQQQGGGYGPPQQGGTYGAPQQGGGFPPPQSAQSYGEPAAAVPPPPKKSRAGRIVLIAVAAVLVLCVGGGAVGWFVLKDEVSEGVEASKTRVVAPETLAGRPKITDPELQSLSDQMVTAMKKTAQGETSAVGAFYGDPAKQDLVMIVGTSGLVADPKKELDVAVTGLGKELGVAKMTPVDPGPLGGEARCGDGKADDAPLGVCLWADRGSVGAIVVFFKSAEEAKADFVAMRGEIEKR